MRCQAKTLIALDPHLLVRLLVNDDTAQAAKVEAWLGKQVSPARPAWVDHVVLCELAWVLERSYNYPRSDVNACIAALLNHKSLKVESPELVRQALALHASQIADFSDCLLAARAQAAGYSPILTFDKKAAKSATHELLR